MKALPILMAAALATPASAAVPLLAPTRDVTVDYAVQPPGHAPLDVHVEIEAGGQRLRISSEDLPTTFLVDRPAAQAAVLLPMLKMFTLVRIGAVDPARTILRNARFAQTGHGNVSGRRCLDWTAISPTGRAEACITPDGVILQGAAYDAHGLVGRIEASMVSYGRLPPDLFEVPSDFRDAGPLPVDRLTGIK